MATFSAAVREDAVALSWSLWAELGVSSWERHHSNYAIDPEPLILFTASLADADPRLRDESTDWCIRYGRYISVARLRNISTQFPPDVAPAFDRLSATVNAHSTLKWPSTSEPWRFKASGKSKVDDFRKPSLVPLRLRAMFGVGARAEIVRAFLANPSANRSANELAPEVGYTKRNVAEALDALRMAGVLETSTFANQIRFRLRAPETLADAVGSLPDYFPRWLPVMRTFRAFLDYADAAHTRGAVVLGVEAHSLIRALTPDLGLIAVAPPTDHPLGEAFAPILESWMREVTAGWAAGDPRFLAGVRRGRPGARISARLHDVGAGRHLAIDSQFDSQSRRTAPENGGRPRTHGGRAEIRSARRRPSTDAPGSA